MLSTFYDEMSPYYHLIFEDWDATIEHQAKIIKGIIDREWGITHRSIVDVSCGIGTQAIGLAQLGYEVEASDLSSQAIKRARQEAEKRNIKIQFSVADMRYSFQHHQKQFDLLISCDNSIPHLLSDTDILAAFKEFHDCIKPGGGCIITIRDYAKENCKGIQFKPYGLRIVDDTKYIIFQIWEFEADIYDLSMYFIIEREHLRIETKVFRSQYYAVSISKIIELLQMAGFTAVKQIESEFYQPIIIGKKTL
ncbi:MAG: class I SAM-dependent methyltransferase [Cyanobacteria bacterium J06638_38]